jgi:hypothetical protein
MLAMPSHLPQVRDDPRKMKFIEWLCTPAAARQPPSQQALAKEMNMQVRTLNRWKTEPDFKEVWNLRATEVIGPPDRAKEVLDSLFEVARNRNARNHVQAAKLYLEAIDAIKPRQINVAVSHDASKLTNEELDVLIALGAAELKAERDAKR